MMVHSIPWCWCEGSGCFPPKCLRQLLGIQWYDRVWNDEVLQRTGLTSLSHLLSRWHISVFGLVAWLDDNTPANMTFQLHIDVSLNRPPDRMWRRPPGRSWNKWLDQLRNDSTHLIGDLWRHAVDRGHGGAMTQWPSPATRWRRWWLHPPHSVVKSSGYFPQALFGLHLVIVPSLCDAYIFSPIHFHCS